MLKVEYTPGLLGFMFATLVFFGCLVYASIVFPKENRQPYKIPEGNVDFQYDWIMKLLERGGAPDRVKEFELMIRRYEHRFIDDRAISERVKKLRTTLLIKSALFSKV